jgi:hypothetical protein
MWGLLRNILQAMYAPLIQSEKSLSKSHIGREKYLENLDMETMFEFLTLSVIPV